MPDLLIPRQRLEIDGAVRLSIAGINTRIRLTLSGFAAYGDLEVGQAGGQDKGRVLQAMLWAMLLPEHPGITMRQVGRLVEPGEMSAISAAVSQCLEYCLPPPDPKKKKGTQEPVDWWLLWSIGRIDLRLTDDEFWDLTLRRFWALTNRVFHNAMLAQANMCRVLAEVNRDSKQRAEPWRMDEFLPAIRRSDMNPEQEKLENVKRMLASAHAAFGGLRRKRG